MKDLVSIIIPAYNHEKYIYDCINSVLNQTYTNIEILVEDDCSTDKTREIISKFKDKRITKIYSKKNKGVVNTINELSNKCNGKYIAVIGSDDIWYPTKIEEQVKILEKNTKLGAVFTEVDFIDENDKKYSDSKVFNYKNISSSKRIKIFYETGNHLCHPSSMIRKKVFDDIGEYNNAYRQLHDYDYWTRLLQKYDIYIINKKLMAYRRNKIDNKSISASNSENTIRVYNELFYINYCMIMNMSNKKFIEAFSDVFKNKQSKTPIELLCEKYFLLINMPYVCNNKSYAFSLIFNNENQKQIFETLEKKFNYTLKDFYKETGDNNQIYPAEIVYEEFEEHLKEKDKVIEDLTNEIKNILNSKSWKITKPIRAVRKLRK